MPLDTTLLSPFAATNAAEELLAILGLGSPECGWASTDASPLLVADEDEDEDQEDPFADDDDEGNDADEFEDDDDFLEDDDDDAEESTDFDDDDDL